MKVIKTAVQIRPSPPSQQLHNEIRKKYKSPKHSLRSLAVEYQVDHSLIWQIVRGKKWNNG